jgi:hypothetical protein
MAARPDTLRRYALLVWRTTLPRRVGTRLSLRIQLKNPNMLSHWSAFATVRSLQQAIRAIVAWLW